MRCERSLRSSCPAWVSDTSSSRAGASGSPWLRIALDGDDAVALAEILGAPRLTEAAAAMQRIEGLAIDWITVEPRSTAAGATIAQGEYRTKTGATIVAVIRDNVSL